MADMGFNLVVLIIGIIGVWAFIGLLNIYIPTRKFNTRKDASKGPDPFKAAGWGITTLQFNLLRYVLYAGYIALMGYQYAQTHKLSAPTLLLLAALYIATNPTLKISLIPVLLRSSNKARARRLNNEVMLSFIQLKSLCLMESKLNGYEIIRKLLRQSKELRPYLAEIATSWQIDERRGTALKNLESNVNTTDAANFVKLLEKLDNTRISDLADELTLYEQSIFETRQTEREKKNEQLGNLMFTLATFLIMAIMLNFVFVGIFPSLTWNFI